MARVRRSRSPGTPASKRYSLAYVDSPSRQLMLDLENALKQVQIHEAEINHVHAYERRKFQESLELAEQRQAAEDVAALDAATARHELVRAEAEAELQKYYRQVEEEENQKREQERKRLEAEQARARAEAERKAKEEEERKAKAERARMAAKKAEEERAKAEQEAQRQREEAEKEKKRKEAQDAAEAAQKATQDQADQEKATQAAAAAQASLRRPTTQSPEKALVHEKYLEIHQRLKTLRKELWGLCLKNPKMKTTVGDMRRAVKASVGQLTETKGANAKPTERIRNILAECATIPGPTSDIRDFMADPPAQFQTPEDSQCPTLLIYMFSIFSKAIVAQFSVEAGVSSSAAEPAGVLTAQMFSAKANLFKGQSLIDVLLAKFHHSCPVLWGALGDEKSVVGRKRLGWRNEDGQFVNENRHFERISGLAAGFASIALRNFTKSTLQNPFPPTNYWECLANLLNVPPNKVQLTHLFVLKAMLEHSVEKFVLFFGSAAVAMLRQALIHLPASLPAERQNTSACQSLGLLRLKLATEKNFILD